MRHARVINTGAIVILCHFWFCRSHCGPPRRWINLIAAAKKEGDLYFVAGPEPLAGKRACGNRSRLQQKFGLNSRILLPPVRK